MAGHGVAILNRKIPDLLLKPEHRLLRHAVVQAVVLLITVNMLWDEPDAILADRLTAWLFYFLQINLAVYGNLYLLVPQLLVRGRTVLYFLSLPLLIVGDVIAIGLLQSGEADELESSFSWLGFISSLTAFSLFIVGLTAVQLFKYHLKNVERINALKSATMAVELANLQSQINPHFLFNMLNNANIMAGEDAEKSSFILTKMKDLLRYQVEAGSRSAVKLRDDIAFIGDYLALEKLRRDRFTFTVAVAGSTDLEVPPLLFIPFVENAVKHNPENDAYVRITFRAAEKSLYFSCENPKAKLPRTGRQGGIGLLNIERRLALLYGKNYSLNIKDEEEVYTVAMEIKL